MYQNVLLPNGETVQVPCSLSSEWFEHKKTGYLHPSQLAQYADQPRMHMSETDLAELQANVASQGVRQSLIVTPSSMAPWATFHDGEEDLPFVIVSGHRRRQTALAAGIEAVPVEVRVYQDRESFEDDADTLNDHRADLSEIEQGHRFRRKVERGIRITHLVTKTGHAYAKIKGRINLTCLCPTIQKRVAPELQSRQRMSIGFAGALGGLKLPNDDDLKNKLAELGDEKPLEYGMSDDDKRFRLQRAYLTFCEKRGWRGVDSKKFVETGEYPVVASYGTGTVPRSKGEDPEKQVPFRYELIDFLQHLNELGLIDMDERDIANKLKLAVRQDLMAMGDRLIIAGDILKKVAGKKRKWSDKSLGDRVRPEQAIFIEVE